MSTARKHEEVNSTEKVITIYDLPPEIIIKMFEYLPLTDVNNASLTNKHWFSCSLDPSIVKKKVLTIREYERRVKKQLRVFHATTNIMRSTQPYYNIKLTCNSAKQRPLTHYLTDMDFWKRMEKSLNCLKIDGIHDGDWQNIFKVLSHLENLESLCLDFNKINRRGSPSLDSTLFKSFKLKKLTYFELRHFEESNDYLINLLGIMPEIIHFHLTIGSSEDKSNIKQLLFDYLNDGKNRIKTLYLNSKPELIRFILTLKKMNFESVQLHNQRDHLCMGIEPIKSFTDKNKLLKLKISLICFFEISEAVDAFPNLQIIAVDSGESVLEVFADYPGNLKKAVNNQSIVQNLQFTRNIYRGEPCILSRNVTFKNVGNLTEIIWPNVEDFLNDEVLQNIFRYLILLKHILIPSLYKSNFPITDYGFTGERENNGEIIEIGYSISNLTNLRSFDFFDQSTCLGDRTLLHFSKLKELRFLKISCKNGSRSAYENLRKSCPLLKAACVVLHPSSY